MIKKNDRIAREDISVICNAFIAFPDAHVEHNSREFGTRKSLIGAINVIVSETILNAGAFCARL